MFIKFQVSGFEFQVLSAESAVENCRGRRKEARTPLGSGCSKGLLTSAPTILRHAMRFTPRSSWKFKLSHCLNPGHKSAKDVRDLNGNAAAGARRASASPLNLNLSLNLNPSRSRLRLRERLRERERLRGVEQSLLTAVPTDGRRAADHSNALMRDLNRREWCCFRWVILTGCGMSGRSCTWTVMVRRPRGEVVCARWERNCKR